MKKKHYSNIKGLHQILNIIRRKTQYLLFIFNMINIINFRLKILEIRSDAKAPCKEYISEAYQQLGWYTG